MTARDLSRVTPSDGVCPLTTVWTPGAASLALAYALGIESIPVPLSMPPRVLAALPGRPVLLTGGWPAPVVTPPRVVEWEADLGRRLAALGYTATTMREGHLALSTVARGRAGGHEVVIRRERQGLGGAWAGRIVAVRVRAVADAPADRRAVLLTAGWRREPRAWLDLWPRVDLYRGEWTTTLLAPSTVEREPGLRAALAAGLDRRPLEELPPTLAPAASAGAPDVE